MGARNAESGSKVFKFAMTGRKVFLLGLFFCLVCAAFSPCPSSANPEYARATGKACIQCHGGGEVAGQPFSSGQPFAHGGSYHRSQLAVLPPSLPPSQTAGLESRLFLPGVASPISAIEWLAALLCLLLIRKPEHAAK